MPETPSLMDLLGPWLGVILGLLAIAMVETFSLNIPPGSKIAIHSRK